MKYLILSAATFGLAFSGCQLNPQEHINPSGAYPDAKMGNVTVPKEGKLVVHRDIPALQPGGQSENSPVSRAGYTVFDEQGGEVKHVEGSETTLPVGRYLIRLDEPTHERTPFWVTIQSGKTTEVDVARLVTPAAE